MHQHQARQQIPKHMQAPLFQTYTVHNCRPSLNFNRTHQGQDQLEASLFRPWSSALSHMNQIKLAPDHSCSNFPKKPANGHCTHSHKQKIREREKEQTKKKRKRERTNKKREREKDDPGEKCQKKGEQGLQARSQRVLADVVTRLASALPGPLAEGSCLWNHSQPLFARRRRWPGNIRAGTHLASHTRPLSIVSRSPGRGREGRLAPHTWRSESSTAWPCAQMLGDHRGTVVLSLAPYRQGSRGP